MSGCFLRLGIEGVEAARAGQWHCRFTFEAFFCLGFEHFGSSVPEVRFRGHFQGFLRLRGLFGFPLCQGVLLRRRELLNLNLSCSFFYLSSSKALVELLLRDAARLGFRSLEGFGCSRVCLLHVEQV